MIIKELYIAGFGKWQDQQFVFTPGINLLTAPNESGKTTLLHALFAALYGMKRDYVKVTRYLPEYDKYLPWNGASYETVIRFQLQGETYRLHRWLAKDREQAKLFREPELLEITREYREDRRKEYLFLEHHLGLTRTMFTDVTWIKREEMSTAERLLPTLLSRQQNDPVASVIMAGIEQELQMIGKKETAENTLLGKANRNWQTTHAELQQAEQALASVRQLTQSLARWQSEAQQWQLKQAELLQQRAVLQQAEQNWQDWWQKSFMVKQATDLEEWIKRTETEQEQQFHQRVWQQLTSLEQKKQSIRQQLEQLTTDSEDKLAQPFHYLSFAEIDPDEWQKWLADWYKWSAYVELPDTAERAQVDLQQLQQDYRAGWELVQQLDHYKEQRFTLAAGAKPAPAEVARMDRSSADKPEPTSITDEPYDASPKKPGEVLLGRRSAALRKKRKQQRLIVAFALALLLSLTSLLWLDHWSALMIAAAVVMAAGFYLAREAGKGKKGDNHQQAQVNQPPPAFRQTDSTDWQPVTEWEIKIRETETELAQLLEKWGAKDWASFIVMRDKYLAQIHQAEAAKKAKRQQRELQTKLEATMLRWGVPAHLPFEQAVELVLTEHAIWEARSKQERMQVEQELAAEKKRHALTAELEQLEIEMEKLLHNWAEETRRELSRQQADWQQRRAAVEASLSEAEQTLAELREKMAEARGEIGQRDQVSWAKAKSAHDEAAEQLDQLLLRREALELAKEVLQEALEEWHRDITPELNVRASAITRQLSQERYRDVRLDPAHNLAIRVVEPTRQKVVAHDQLSSGTQDQLYFAQRLALVSKISEEKEPLPIFLDDHFIHYDQQRLEAALRYLLTLSERHQVFLFSCHEREQQFLMPLFDSERHQLLHL